MKIVKLTATIAGAAMLVNVIPAVASAQMSSSGQFQHSSDLSKRVEKKPGQKTPNESLRYSEVAMLLDCVKRFSEIFCRPMLIPSMDVFQSRCH